MRKDTAPYSACHALICAVMAGFTAPAALQATTAQGIGLDGAAFVADFGGSRMLSGDGSTVYVDLLDDEVFNLRYTKETGPVYLPNGSFTFFAATSFDGSLASAWVNKDQNFNSYRGPAVVRFDESGRSFEDFPIRALQYKNPVFIGGSALILARKMDYDLNRDVLTLVEPIQTSFGLEYFETEYISPAQDMDLINLGSNAAGQAVGFYEARNGAPDYDLAFAGFYLVDPEFGSLIEVPIDFSPVILDLGEYVIGPAVRGAVVKPGSMSPGGRFVIIDFDTPGTDDDPWLYDFETDEISKIRNRLPIGMGFALEAYLQILFPGEDLGLLWLERTVKHVDAEGNLFGETINSSNELVGTFVVTNTPAPRILGFETYLAGVLAEPDDMSLTEFLSAVELLEVITFSEDGSAVLVAGIDEDGFKDLFLLEIKQSSDEMHSIDNDNDSLPDAWEIEQAGGLSTSISPTQDLAGDGLSALEEFFFGLPLDGGHANSPIGPLMVGGDALVFEFTRRSHIDLLEFDIEASSTLEPDSWEPISPLLQNIETIGDNTRYRATVHWRSWRDTGFLRFSIRPK